MDHIIYTIFMILLVQHFIPACYGHYLCGPNETPYSPLISRCVDNKIQRRTSPTRSAENAPNLGSGKKIACLLKASGRVKIIDTRKYDCKHGEIVENAIQTSTTPSTTRPVVNTNASPNPDVCKTGQASLLPTGYACCYDMLYKPEDETCCKMFGVRKIFNGSERTHICCKEEWGFSIHLRGSPDIPCQHASTNDKLFRKVKRFRILEQNLRRTCQKVKYVFRIEVVNQMNRWFAKLTAWMFSPFARRKKIRKVKSLKSDYQIEISGDEYSPRTNKIRPKSFLVLTDFDYFSQAVFFLKPDDYLFKFPGNKDRLKKVLKRLSKKCRKSKRDVLT